MLSLFVCSATIAFASSCQDADINRPREADLPNFVCHRVVWMGVSQQSWTGAGFKFLWRFLRAEKWTSSATFHSPEVFCEESKGKISDLGRSGGWVRTRIWLSDVLYERIDCQACFFPFPLEIPGSSRCVSMEVVVEAGKATCEKQKTILFSLPALPRIILWIWTI